jgi:hypothetical protein
MKENLFDLKTQWEKIGSLSKDEAHSLALNLTEIRDHCETLSDILDNKIIKGTIENDAKLLYKGLGGYKAWVLQLIEELKEAPDVLDKARSKVRKAAFPQDENDE